jgi:hypothetical protein
MVLVLGTQCAMLTRGAMGLHRSAAKGEARAQPGGWGLLVRGSEGRESSGTREAGLRVPSVRTFVLHPHAHGAKRHDRNRQTVRVEVGSVGGDFSWSSPLWRDTTLRRISAMAEKGGGEKGGKGEWRFSPSMELGRAARRKGDGAPSVASAQATAEVVPRLDNCADDDTPR